MDITNATATTDTSGWSPFATALLLTLRAGYVRDGDHDSIEILDRALADRPAVTRERLAVRAAKHAARRA